MKSEKGHYYPSLDEFTELHMTTFGKMKLSVIPEGVSMAVYNYFKSSTKFPSYEEFFEYCIHQCETTKHDLKPRYDRFYKACEKYKIDPNGVTTLPNQKIEPSEDKASLDIEDEFWKIERHKLTPDGIAGMYANGEILNPYRKRMICLGCYKHDTLFNLYIQAYPDSKKVKDFESHRAYLNVLLRTFLAERLI
jgi:hypothetical protein